MSADQLRLPVTEEWRVGDRILTNMKEEELRQAYLKALRKEMHDLWMRRARDPDVDDPTVCADDAREVFESWDPPSPDRLNRNFLGQLFRDGNWRKVGHTRSRTDGSHGNLIAEWEPVPA